MPKSTKVQIATLPSRASKYYLKIVLIVLGAALFALTLLFTKQSSTKISSSSNSSQNIFQAYQDQAAGIVQQMSIEQKIGQMLLPTIELLANDKHPKALKLGKKFWFKEDNLKKLGRITGLDGIKKYHIGAILTSGGTLAYSGDDQSIENWKKLAAIANLYYDGPANTMLLLGTDAIHGNQHVTGSILFPQNIGLGATHNPELVQKVAEWTGRDVASSGFNWSFMPTVTIAKDYRWGRTYESFGEDPALVKTLSYHYILGLQKIVDGRITGVLGGAKHFIGDGDTKNGVDEGYAYAENLDQFWKESGAGYEGSVEADAASLMVSYSSLNDIPMHFGGDFNVLNQFLNPGIKGSNGHIYKFGGFVVSDYVGVSRAAYKHNLLGQGKISYVEALAKTINSGIDMLMIANGAYENPFDYNSAPPYEMKSKTYYDNIQTVQRNLLEAINQGLITAERIDEAVTRIIKTKLSFANQAVVMLTDDEKNRQAGIALEAAQQSLVLLKNENATLPIKQERLKNLFIMGDYDDSGIQNGGWTVNWQGQKGNKYWEPDSINKKMAFATTLSDGVKHLLGEKVNYYEGESSILAADLSAIEKESAIALIVISEPPYAEYMGDIDNQNPFYIKGALIGENSSMPETQSDFLGVKFNAEQLKSIELLKKQGIKIVTILYSGRPVVITGEGNEFPLNSSDAFIAAFLPGTSAGEALTNALFGKYQFKSHKNTIEGKAVFSNTLPFAWPASMEEVRTHTYTLFPAGYGLET